MEVMKVEVVRWIVVDERGIRRSKWYSTEEEAVAELAKKEEGQPESRAVAKL